MGKVEKFREKDRDANLLSISPEDESQERLFIKKNLYANLLGAERQAIKRSDPFPRA